MKTETMKLIKKKLDEIAKEDWKCNVCGCETMTIDRGAYFLFYGKLEKNTKRFHFDFGEGLPLIATGCKKCYKVNFHSMLRMIPELKKEDFL